MHIYLVLKHSHKKEVKLFVLGILPWWIECMLQRIDLWDACERLEFELFFSRTYHFSWKIVEVQGFQHALYELFVNISSIEYAVVEELDCAHPDWNYVHEFFVSESEWRKERILVFSIELFKVITDVTVSNDDID